MFPMIALVASLLASTVFVEVRNQAPCGVRVQAYQQGSTLGRAKLVGPGASTSYTVENVQAEMPVSFRIIPTAKCYFPAYNVSPANNMATFGEKRVEVLVGNVPNATLVRPRL